MPRKPKFRPEITRVKLSTEQVVIEGVTYKEVRVTAKGF
jgi:hypothetical protein